jgi:hypothetical protein
VKRVLAWMLDHWPQLAAVAAGLTLFALIMLNR